MNCSTTKLRRQTTLIIGLSLLVLGHQLHSGNVPRFEDKETVCFVGDSITHAGTYISILRHVYATKFPDRKVKMVNCGISGDSLPNVLDRFDRDVMVNKPSSLVIMLGMNDIGRNRFGKGTTGIEQGKPDGAVMAFEANLKRLITKCKQANITRITLMSPTIYDQYVVSKSYTPSFTGCDQGLAAITDVVKRQAAANSYEFIDQHTPMLAYTKQQQAKDPAFSLINHDRVHPNTRGHYLMAYQILKAQALPKTASQITIDLTTKQSQSKNADVTALIVSKDKIQFKVKLQTLPMVFPSCLQDTPGICAMFRDFNREQLKVTGLAAGNYDLTIDGQLIGQYTSKELSSGIDLQDNPNTPDFLQAFKLYSLNEHLRDLEVSRIRNPLAARKFLKYGRSSYEKETGQKLPNDDVAAAKILLKKNNRGYVPSLYQKLVQYGSPDIQDKTRAEMTALREQIHTAAQPQLHQWTLTRTNPKASVNSKPQAGTLTLTPTQSTMTDAWPDNRTKTYHNTDKLSVSGAPVNGKITYLSWKLPSTLDAANIQNARIVLKKAYANNPGKLFMGELTSSWTPQTLNYYHSPSRGPRLTDAIATTDGWELSGPEIAKLVKQWLATPDQNFGVWVGASSYNGYAGISKTDPPQLIIESSKK